MRRQHLLAMEQQLRLLVEADLVPPRELQAAVPADPREPRVDGRRIQRRRFQPLESEQDRAVGAVAPAGQRRRAEQVHLHRVRACKQAALSE